MAEPSQSGTSESAQEPNQEKRGRRGREARKHARSAGQGVNVSANIVRQIPETNFLTDEGAEIIEANADQLLQEIGIEFRDSPHVLELWREAGADVDGVRVRFPKGLLRQLLKTAPSRFVQKARAPEKSVDIGGNNIVFAPVYGSPFVTDLDRGRRYGTIEDFQNLVKLAYMSPWLNHSGGTICEPVDLPVGTRHLDMVYAHMKYSDRPFMGSVTAGSRAQDSLEMARILFGADFVEQNCVMVQLINANSPLVFDGTMLAALQVYAGGNQACIVSPFILAGAMSPVTPAGTLTQVLAEAMAGCALTQLIRPGAPVIFGAFVSSISMQSGAPTFGTPEGTLLINGAAKLARRLNLPFRSGGSFSGSKLPDAQSGYESSQTLLATVLSGVNFVLHAAGWLEGGLATSYEKLIIDCDQLAMMRKLVEGINLTAEGQAMDALHEVGPGGHFLGAAHTRRHFETAFYRSEIADNNSFEQWSAEGSLNAAKRANTLYKEKLAAYQAPAMDPAIDDALTDFMNRRKNDLANEPNHG